MTKINNTNIYTYDTNISGEDFIPGSDSDTIGKITKSYKINDIKAFVLSGLSPETGGLLRISEIVIEDEELTTPADAINVMTPVYDVLRYHLVYVKLNGQQFLFKQQDVTIGDGQNLVTNDDFVEFPVSVGPQGPTGNTGATGEDGREVQFQTSVTHIQWRYVGEVSWTNLIALSELIGPQGEPGANGTNGEDGVSVVASGTTTSVSGTGSLGDPYKVELVNLQKTLTSPASFTAGNYTLVSADNFYTIFIDNGADDVTITVPTGLVSKFEAGFVQKGTGDVTFVESGTNIFNPVGLKSKGQYYNTFIEKDGTTTDFYLFGNTKA